MVEFVATLAVRIDPAKFVERVDLAVDAVAVDQRGCATGQIGDAFQYGAPERSVQYRVVHRSDKHFSLSFVAHRHLTPSATGSRSPMRSQYASSRALRTESCYCAIANMPPAKECHSGDTLIGQFRSFTASSAMPP